MGYEITPNRKVFLDTIAWAEGTAGRSQDGYATMVGGTQFSGANYPGKVIEYKPGKFSSAAGRYQIVQKTWNGVRRSQGLTDFSPASQDQAAIALIAGRGALPDVDAGNWDAAIRKVGPEWASFPNNNYKQNPKKATAIKAKIGALSAAQAGTVGMRFDPSAVLDTTQVEDRRTGATSPTANGLLGLPDWVPGSGIAKDAVSWITDGLAKAGVGLLLVSTAAGLVVLGLYTSVK